MLLLVLYNVRSERELMGTIAERLDVMWFLGYELDDEIPSQSVLSKAPTPWGVEAFKHFFEKIVCQCVEAGLGNGSKFFMNSSLVQADTGNDSVLNRESLKRYLKQSYQELETRLEGQPSETSMVGRNKPALYFYDRSRSLCDPSGQRVYEVELQGASGGGWFRLLE